MAAGEAAGRAGGQPGAREPRPAGRRPGPGEPEARSSRARTSAASRRIAEALAPLDGAYDFAILDTAPGWDALSVNALFYATEVLAPVSLEVMTLQSLLDFNQSLAAIQRYHPALALRYILPTFLDRRVRKSDEILAQLASHFGARLCAPIRYNVRLSEAPGYGQTIFEYAPHSPGADDYRALDRKDLERWLIVSRRRTSWPSSSSAELPPAAVAPAAPAVPAQAETPAANKTAAQPQPAREPQVATAAASASPSPTPGRSRS